MWEKIKELPGYVWAMVGFVVSVLLLHALLTGYQSVDFHRGSSRELALVDWTKEGVFAKDKEGQRRFFFYAEISRIDDDFMEELGAYVLFMRALSSAKKTITFQFSKPYRDRPVYDREGNRIKDKKKMCSKGGELTKDFDLYNKNGSKKAVITCSRGKLRQMRFLYDDGSPKIALTYKMGEVIGVERFQFEPMFEKGGAAQ